MERLSASRRIRLGVTVFRALAVAVAVLVLATLTACGAPGGEAPKVSLEELARQTLGALPGVASLDVKQTPVGGS